MKINQLLLVIAFPAATFAAQAQPTKGSVLIGGNLVSSYSKYEGDPLIRFTLDPLAGYFLSDRIAIGAKVSPQLYLIPDGDPGIGFSVSLGPLARYYFNGSGSTRFFGQGSINYWPTIDSRFGFNLSVGLDCFFNEHAAFEAFLDYDNIGFEEDDKTTSIFGVGIGIVWIIIGRGGGDK